MSHILGSKLSTPLSLREEAELRAGLAPEGGMDGLTAPTALRLLATLSEERREREAALAALRAEEQRNALLTAKCDSLRAGPATVQQPAPVVNDSPEVWPEVMWLAEAHLGRNSSELLCADMAARAQMGRSKYGTALLRDNSRSAAVDAYQEALDLAAYMQQERMRQEARGRAAGVWRRRLEAHLELCFWLCDQVRAEQAEPR